MYRDETLRVTAVHPNGRRTFDPQSKARLIERCFEPGASVAKLALEHGVNANLLWKWIRDYRRGQKVPVPASPAFVPVELETAAAAVSRDTSAGALDVGSDYSAPDMTPLSSPAKLTVSLPNGVKLALDCGDLRAMSTMIELLGRCHVQPRR